MSEPNPQPKTLDHIGTKFLLLVEKRKELERLKAEVLKLEREVRTEVGTAEEATIQGEVVITNRPVERFKEAEFRKDNPTLYKEYTRRVSRQEFDTAAFRADHPNLFTQYQSRQFLFKVD